MAILLGIDTGGTYTDAALFDNDANTIISSAKALTTKHDLSIDIRGALDAALPHPPPDIRMVSLSTTLATNAIVEGQGNPICLLLLGYPQDALDRSRLREAIGDDRAVFIDGGHTVTGDEQMPLDLEAARQAIQRHAPQVAAFAVSGYFAVRNPAHELGGGQHGLRHPRSLGEQGRHRRRHGINGDRCGSRRCGGGRSYFDYRGGGERGGLCDRLAPPPLCLALYTSSPLSLVCP